MARFGGQKGKESEMCPFLDGADSRCGSWLDLNHISEAIRTCGFDYENCPLYYELREPRRVPVFLANGKRGTGNLAQSTQSQPA